MRYEYAFTITKDPSGVLVGYQGNKNPIPIRKDIARNFVKLDTISVQDVQIVKKPSRVILEISDLKVVYNFYAEKLIQL